MNKHLRNFLILLAGQTIAVPLTITQTVLIARVLGPSGMGSYAMITAAAMLCFSISLTWTQSATLRYGAEEWENSKTLVGIWSGRIIFILTGFLITFALLYLHPFEWLSRFYSIQGNWWLLIFSYTLSLWLVSEVKSIAQITGDFVLSVAISLIASMSFVGILVYYMLIADVVTVEQILLPLITINIIVFGTCWFVFVYKTKCNFFKISIQQSRKVLVYSWPLLFSILASYAADWGNHIIIRSHGNINDVGLYTTAQTVALGFIAVAGPIGTIIQPRLISKGANNQLAASEYLWKVAPTITFLWLFATVPIITLMPYLFTPFFGKQFIGSIPLLAVFTAALPGAIIASLYSGLFLLQGRLFWIVFYNAIMTFASLFGSYLLIPYFGFISAAVCLSMSYVGTQILYYFDQRHNIVAPSHKMDFMFALTIIFSALAIALSNSMLMRLTFMTAGYVILIFLARSRMLVDDMVVTMLFSGKLEFLVPIVRKTLIPGNHSGVSS